MQNEHPNSNREKCDSIVESLYKEFSLRTGMEFKDQKAIISEQYNAKHSFYSGAHIKAIVKAELDHIQQLVDYLIGKIEADFSNIPLADFKKKLSVIISQEYDRAIPVLEEFAKGISRGSNVGQYIKPVTDAKKNNLEILDARCKLRQVKKTINKPSVFISHANEDAVLARAIKTQIDNVFEKKVNVFVSSITISPGSDWFDKILGSLTENDAFIVLVTSYSEKRPFVWFEIGFSWLRRLNNKCEIYAICAPPIDHGNLPEPLCRLQAISLAEEDRTTAFFEKLTKQFKLGNLDALKFARIRDSLSTYPSQISQREAADGADDSLYATYSPGELKQVLFDILSQEKKYHRDPVTRSPIFDGRLIDYKEFDEKHRLPVGTGKKYLKEVGADKKFQLEVEFEDENTIRFKKKTEFII